MAQTEQKLRLLRQIRLEQTKNTQTMQTRQAVLYGKPLLRLRSPSRQKNPLYTEEDWEEGEYNHRKRGGMGYSSILPRVFATALLCAGVFYLFRQDAVLDTETASFLRGERLCDMKNAFWELLIRDDLPALPFLDSAPADDWNDGWDEENPSYGIGDENE